VALGACDAIVCVERKVDRVDPETNAGYQQARPSAPRWRITSNASARSNQECRDVEPHVGKISLIYFNENSMRTILRDEFRNTIRDVQL